eukprot:TRINITY_DN53757_c0_g1_i1.p2 TRINITY_DN53757_c0_g1~~TRINITY_DN53757_c0_g1_i1.p2  ORF type:complete len:591 (+),score=74.13 TRINITY_DN53757_c0_g1_i1:73-1845(+)
MVGQKSLSIQLSPGKPEPVIIPEAAPLNRALVIPLPKPILAGDDSPLPITVFGLQKKIFAGYQTSFSMRFQASPQDMSGVTHQLEVTITITETDSPVPQPVAVSYTLDAETGDYCIEYTPPAPGVVQILMELHTIKEIIITDHREEVVAPVVTAPRGRVFGALRHRQQSLTQQTANPQPPTLPPIPQKPQTARTGSQPQNSPRHALLALLPDVPKPSPPTGPTPAPPQSSHVRRERSVTTILGGAQTVQVLDGVYETVGPEGGTVTIDGVALVIPPDALSQTIDMSLSKQPRTAYTWKRGFTTMTLKSCVAVLNPPGIVFAKPVTVQLAYANNNRYPRPAIGKLAFLLWQDEASAWQEIPGGTFSNGKAEIEATSFACIAVGSKTTTDASLLPVVIVFNTKPELLAQAKIFYQQLLPYPSLPKGLGGHLLLAQLSYLRDKKKDDKHLYPPASLGLYMEAHRPDSLFGLALNRKIDIISITGQSTEKSLFIRIRNRLSQPIRLSFLRGMVFEQVEWQNNPHQHLVISRDSGIDVKGLQDLTVNIGALDLSDALQAAKGEEMNVTPFVIEKPAENCKTQSRLWKHVSAHMEW